MAWLERQGQFQNLWHHNLENKQLQYTQEKLLLKNQAQNVMEKISSDPFLKKSKLSISLDQ